MSRNDKGISREGLLFHCYDSSRQRPSLQASIFPHLTCILSSLSRRPRSPPGLISWCTCTTPGQNPSVVSSNKTEMDQSNPGGDPDMRVMFTFYYSRDMGAMISMSGLVSFHMSEGGVATFSPSLRLTGWERLLDSLGRPGVLVATHAALKARSPTRLLSGHFDCSVRRRKNKGREVCLWSV